MECFYWGGGSRYHLYEPYKTFFTRKTRYRCRRPCGSCSISEQEYQEWLLMKLKRDKLIEEWFKTR